MTSSGAELPPDDVSEADWAEQQTIADPLLNDDEDATPTIPVETLEANLADVAEQGEVVYLPEEDEE